MDPVYESNQSLKRKDFCIFYVNRFFSSTPTVLKVLNLHVLMCATLILQQGFITVTVCSGFTLVPPPLLYLGYWSVYTLLCVEKGECSQSKFIQARNPSCIGGSVVEFLTATREAWFYSRPMHLLWGDSSSVYRAVVYERRG